MARSAGGTYSLPTGNPVSNGTTISATTHNNTMSDVGTELTDSLSRSGKGPMLAPLEATDGSVGTPSISFDNDTDCGLYRATTNTPAMSAGGAQAQKWESTGTTCPLGVTVTNSQSNGHGITTTGNGTGEGVVATGGSSNGTGVIGTGGATNGTGVAGVATGNGDGVQGTAAGSGYGVKGTGYDNASSSGVYGLGIGASPGGTFVGDQSVGVVCTGGSGRAPLRLTTGTAPTTAIIGDLYADASGILYICTNAAGPTWTKVGTQS